MGRECPSCRRQMGRLRIDTSRRSEKAWFQLSRWRLNCPRCGVEVRPIAKPMGYVFQRLCIGSGVVGLWLFSKTGPGSWAALAGVGGALVLIGIFAWCAQRWGFRYAQPAERADGT